MTNVIQFAGVTAAIVGSMALALWIEWVSLRGLMRLMPRRNGSATVAAGSALATADSIGKSGGGGKQ